MRHPVSTLTASRGSERLRGVMAGDVVHGTVLPAAPEDTDPRSGEDADGVLMATATRAGALVDEGRPARSVAGIISEGREGSAQVLVAGPAEDHGVVLTGGLSDRRQSGLSGELVAGGEARAIVAELGEDLGGVDGAAAGQALDERTIGMLRQRGRNGSGELLEVRHQRGEHRDESADEFTARLGLRLAGQARGRAAQTGEQVGRRAAATVGVLPEELDQALFAEAGRAVRRGVAGKEREGDRRVDVGKDFRRAGPEALEERAKLVGERDALGDEIVPAAHEGAQRARVIGGRAQGSEAMAVRAEQIGEDERIAGVTLAAGGGVARATGLEGVGVDRHHLEPGLEEGVDEHARGPFEGDADEPAPAKATQVAEELGEALGGMWDGALP